MGTPQQQSGSLVCHLPGQRCCVKREVTTGTRDNQIWSSAFGPGSNRSWRTRVNCPHPVKGVGLFSKDISIRPRWPGDASLSPLRVTAAGDPVTKALRACLAAALRSELCPAHPLLKSRWRQRVRLGCFSPIRFLPPLFLLPLVENSRHPPTRVGDLRMRVWRRHGRARSPVVSPLNKFLTVIFVSQRHRPSV